MNYNYWFKIWLDRVRVGNRGTCETFRWQQQEIRELWIPHWRLYNAADGARPVSRIRQVRLNNYTKGVKKFEKTREKSMLRFRQSTKRVLKLFKVPVNPKLYCSTMTSYSFGINLNAIKHPNTYYKTRKPNKGWGSWITASDTVFFSLNYSL